MEANATEPAEPSAVPPSPGRRRLTGREKFTVSAAVFAIVASGVGLTFEFWPAPRQVVHTCAWYSDDDGKTWFDDDAERIPPFDHHGRPAVRLHLFRCDSGGSPFVGYLQKLPDEAFESFRAKGVDPSTVDDDELAEVAGWVVRAAGQADWVNSQRAWADYCGVVEVRCPGGQRAEEVFPEEPKKRQ